MTRSYRFNKTSLLLLVAGAKGAMGATLAVALAAMQSDAASVLPSLAGLLKLERECEEKIKQ